MILSPTVEENKMYIYYYAVIGGKTKCYLEYAYYIKYRIWRETE